MGDDGFGIKAIERLQQLDLPLSVELIDGGCGGLKLLPLLADCRQLIIIDAADFGAEPGSRRILSDKELHGLPPAAFQKSGHHIGLAELLDAAQKLGQLPPTTLYLVQIKSCLRNRGLSTEITPAFTDLSKYILELNRTSSPQ